MDEKVNVHIDTHFIRWAIVGSAFIWFYHQQGISDLVSFDSLFLLLEIELAWVVVQIVFWFVIALFTYWYISQKTKNIMKKNREEEYELVDDD